MGLSLSSPKIKLQLTASYINTLTDGSTTSVSQPNLNYNKTLTSGVSENQANRAWQVQSRSIASGAQETIDLFDFVGFDIGAGEGNDALGQAMLLEEIVNITIVNENAVGADGQLEILPASSQGWTPIGTHSSNEGALRGQGMLMKTQLAEAGFDVVDGSSHRITLRAVGGAVSYSMYIFGRHDDGESSSSSSSLSSLSSVSSVSSLSSSSSSVSSSSASSSSSSSSVSTSSVSSVSSLSSSSSSSSISTSSVSTSSSSISTSSVSSSSSSSSSVSSSSSSSASSSSSSSSSSISTSSVSSLSSSSSSSVSTSSSSSSSSSSSESSSSLSSGSSSSSSSISTSSVSSGSSSSSSSSSSSGSSSSSSSESSSSEVGG